MSVSFSYVPPSVYILGFKLTVRLNLQFFLFPFERPLRRVLLHCTCHLCLHCWHFLWKEFRPLYFRCRLSGYFAKPTLLDEI